MHYNVEVIVDKDGTYRIGTVLTWQNLEPEVMKDEQREEFLRTLGFKAEGQVKTTVSLKQRLAAAKQRRERIKDLRDNQHLTFKQIGERVGVSDGRAAELYHQARREAARHHV